MDISMNIKYVKSGVKSKNQGKNHIQSKRMIFTKTCQNQAKLVRINKTY